VCERECVCVCEVSSISSPFFFSEWFSKAQEDRLTDKCEKVGEVTVGTLEAFIK
jgi:hypothetical protein